MTGRKSRIRKSSNRDSASRSTPKAKPFRKPPESSPDPLDFINQPGSQPNATVDSPDLSRSKRRRPDDVEYEGSPTRKTPTLPKGDSNAAKASSVTLPNQHKEVPGYSSPLTSNFSIATPVPTTPPPLFRRTKPLSPYKASNIFETTHVATPTEEPAFYPRFHEFHAISPNRQINNLLQSPHTPTSHPPRASITQPSPLSARKLRKLLSSQDQISTLRHLFEIVEDVFEAEDRLLPPSSWTFQSPKRNVPSPTPKAPVKSSSDIFIYSCDDFQSARPFLNPKTLISLISALTSCKNAGAVDELESLSAENWVPIRMEHILRILKICQITLESFNAHFVNNEPDNDPNFKKRQEKNTNNSKMKDKVASTELTPENSNKEMRTRAWMSSLIPKLSLYRSAALAIRAILTILTSGKLPKQAYSEDSINMTLESLSNQLQSTVLPLVACLRESSSHFDGLVDLINQSTSAVMALSDLVNQEEISEATIVLVVFSGLKILLCEHLSSSNIGSRVSSKDRASQKTLSSYHKQLAIASFNVIQSTFSRYPQHRKWILEEILLSLSQMQNLENSKPLHHLPGGQCIHSISALFLYLVQGTALGSRQLLSATYDTLRNKEVVDFHDGKQKNQNQSSVESLSLKELEPAMESATKSTKLIVRFLFSNLGKSSTRGTFCKVVLEHLVNDLLVVMEYPEFPASNFMLFVIAKAMHLAVEDTSNSTEANAVRSSCIEPLGNIWKKIYVPTSESSIKLKPMAQILTEWDKDSLQEVHSLQSKLITYLISSASKDNSNQLAADFYLALWGQEISQAFEVATATLAPNEKKPKLNSNELSLIKTFRQALVEMGRSCCSLNETAMSIDPSEVEARIPEFLSLISSRQPLQSLSGTILVQIISVSNYSNAILRTKALRALGSMIERDPSLFQGEYVQSAVLKRLMDNSSSTRDAALELLGRQVSNNTQLSADLLPHILDRVSDMAISVRKRTLKLLKGMYFVIGRDERVEVAIKLVGRLSDEDVTVQDMAVVAINELWFPRLTSQSKVDSCQLKKDRDEFVDYADFPEDFQITEDLETLVRVTGISKERACPIEDVIRAIVDKHGGAKNPSVTSLFRSITYSLIDCLSDSNHPDTKFIDCIKTVHMIMDIVPKVLSPAKASSLLPYLKNAATVEEQVIADYLLKIFRSYMEDSPKSATKFAQNLQKTLLPMVNRPNTQPGSQSLQDLIACYSSVVLKQTHDYKRLVDIYKTCDSRIQAELRKISAGDLSDADLRALPLLASITALFCEHVNYDQLRHDEEIASGFDFISESTIVDHTYETLACLYEFAKLHKSVIQTSFLQSLGFIFRGHPSMMTRDTSLEIMDEIFENDDIEARINLLIVISAFLSSQTMKSKVSDRNNPNEGNKCDVNAMIGNTEMFEESGVASSIIQRYMSIIQQAAESSNIHAQRCGLDILTFTVQHGLTHPVQNLGVLVALETSDNPAVEGCAFSLHSILHTRHSNLLNARLLECIRESWQYQMRMTGGIAHGSRGDPPVALLNKWFGLLKEKRQWRLDFLKALIKVFNFDDVEVTIEILNFVRYVTENLATLEYRTMEEVLYVVKSISANIDVVAIQVHQRLEDIWDGYEENANGYVDGVEAAEEEEVTHLLNQSLIITFGILVRGWLKRLYMINDAKCEGYVIGKRSTMGDKPVVKKECLQGQSLMNAYEEYPALYLAEDTNVLWSHGKLFMQLVDKADLNASDIDD